MPHRARVRAVAASTALGLTLGLVVIAAGEAAVALALRYPGLVDPRPGGLLFSYYMQHDRRIVQFLPECAEYDAALTYRLRPGGCRVANREHVVDYRINAQGLRDDEASLTAPEIIVLGDSHAMGWGVGQEETFAQLVEHRSGARVLNAAISSYGTVRELALLERLDTSRLRHLVIQYGHNDYHENRTFIEQGALPISGPESYAAAVARHRQARRYFPGKHVAVMARLWRRRPPLRGRAAGRLDDEAAALLEVLRRSPVALDEVEVTVFEVNGSARNSAAFAAALRRAAAAAPWPAAGSGRLRILDLSAQLTAEHYFVLDDHINAAGHRLIAERLLSALLDSPARD